MKSPFVWFGGKRRVATEVWAALGDGNHANRKLECLWISPHCLNTTPTLFEVADQ